MEKVLEPRREWWMQAAAWAACILYRAGNDKRWQEFYALASAMAQGRALKEIPLMYKVASQTVSAWEHRLDLSQCLWRWPAIHQREAIGEAVSGEGNAGILCTARDTRCGGAG